MSEMPSFLKTREPFDDRPEEPEVETPETLTPPQAFEQWQSAPGSKVFVTAWGEMDLSQARFDDLPEPVREVFEREGIDPQDPQDIRLAIVESVTMAAEKPDGAEIEASFDGPDTGDPEGPEDTFDAFGGDDGDGGGDSGEDEYEAEDEQAEAAQRAQPQPAGSPTVADGVAAVVAGAGALAGSVMAAAGDAVRGTHRIVRESLASLRQRSGRMEQRASAVDEDTVNQLRERRAQQAQSTAAQRVAALTASLAALESRPDYQHFASALQAAGDDEVARDRVLRQFNAELSQAGANEGMDADEASAAGVLSPETHALCLEVQERFDQAESALLESAQADANAGLDPSQTLEEPLGRIQEAVKGHDLLADEEGRTMAQRAREIAQRIVEMLRRAIDNVKAAVGMAPRPAGA